MLSLLDYFIAVVLGQFIAFSYTIEIRILFSISLSVKALLVN